MCATVFESVIYLCQLRFGLITCVSFIGCLDVVVFQAGGILLIYQRPLIRSLGKDQPPKSSCWRMRSVCKGVSTSRGYAREYFGSMAECYQPSAFRSIWDSLFRSLCVSSVQDNVRKFRENY